MIKSNIENLLEIGVIGEVTHTAVDFPYSTTWKGEPTLSLGRGGIIYNVKPGDSCFGWAWGEKVEPGVSVDGIGNDREKGSFRNFSCIGNQAKVVNGDAKNSKGIIVGKIGGLPGRSQHIIIHFDEETKEKLAIGDKIQVRSIGVGLKLTNLPNIRCVGVSPLLLKTMGLEEKNGKLIVPVTTEIPAIYVGQGSGGQPVEASNWDVMTQSPDTLEDLKNIKLGDVVILNDILSIYGRGYYEGASTIGIVSCGASQKIGQGIGVTTLFSCKKNKINPILTPDANISKYFGIGGN